MHGADFLCYLTPAEHLGLPTEEDVRIGVRTTKIAAQAANVLKHGTAWDRDLAMAKARVARNDEEQIRLAINQANLTAAFAKSPSHGCAVCRDTRCPADVAAEFFGLA